MMVPTSDGGAYPDCPVLRTDRGGTKGNFQARSLPGSKRHARSKATDGEPASTHTNFGDTKAGTTSVGHSRRLGLTAPDENIAKCQRGWSDRDFLRLYFDLEKT